jgi:hypothetical protein
VADETVSETTSGVTCVKMADETVSETTSGITSVTTSQTATQQQPMWQVNTIVSMTANQTLKVTAGCTSRGVMECRRAQVALGFSSASSLARGA